MEHKHWLRINPDGKTREAFERGEKPLGLDSREAMSAKIQKHRVANFRKLALEVTPKTIEEVEFIGLVQTYITEERKELGLPRGYFIPLETLRLVVPEKWDSPDEYGNYKYRLDAVDIKRNSTPNPFDHFKAMSHELRHQASHLESDPLEGNLYTNIGCRNLIDGVGYGLDEAVTESSSLRMLDRYCKQLQDIFFVDGV